MPTIEELKSLLKYFAAYSASKCYTDMEKFMYENFSIIANYSEKLVNNPRLKLNRMTEELHTRLETLQTIVTSSNYDFDSRLKAVKRAGAIMCLLLKQLSIHVGKINPGGKKLFLKELPSAPLAVFYEAIRKHESLAEDEQDLKLFYRKMALIALAGGIPYEYLGKQPDFTFQAEHFKTIGLPLVEKANLNKKSRSDQNPDLDYDIMNEHFNKASMSKLGKKMQFWDPLISAFFKENDPSWLLCSELNVTEMLNLDCEFIADMTVISPNFNIPVLFIEAQDEDISSASDHKAFTKLATSLSISCIKQALKMHKMGQDPTCARSFGMLIGGNKVQLSLCVPIQDIFDDDGKDFIYEFYTCIYMHDHWLLDLNSNTDNNITCSKKCCADRPNSRNLNASDTDFKVLVNAVDSEIVENFDFSIESVVNEHEDDENANLDEETTVASHSASLNRDAFAKLSAFFENGIKFHLKDLADYEETHEDDDDYYEVKDLCVKYIPTSVSGDVFGINLEDK